jgi:hypothetical protein
MLQPRQNNLLARLLNLARQKDLVQDGIYFVKIKDEIQLADVAEEGIEHLDEEVNGLEVGEFRVVGVDAGAEEQARVPPVHDLVVAELDKVGLVLLVARGHEAVDLAFQLDLFGVGVGRVPLCEPGFAPEYGGWLVQATWANCLGPGSRERQMVIRESWELTGGFVLG